VYPPHPMVSQIRTVLKAYVRNGRSYWEETIEDCGHSPHEGSSKSFDEPSSVSLLLEAQPVLNSAEWGVTLPCEEISQLR
jgi:hypothetical protein